MTSSSAVRASGVREAGGGGRGLLRSFGDIGVNVIEDLVRVAGCCVDNEGMLGLKDVELLECFVLRALSVGGPARSILGDTELAK